MPGISRSSVTTCGLSSKIFFRPKLPSMAVPATWMHLSFSRICGMSFRISAESSTTSTRMGEFKPVPSSPAPPVGIDQRGREAFRKRQCRSHSAANGRSAPKLRKGSGSAQLVRRP